MGAPMPDMEPVENASAEALLDSLKTIDPAERRKHASVFNYWLSIRKNRQFPPIRDLDPLEISDAGPWSILLEMIGGGEDAVIRHFGQDIRCEVEVETIAAAPSPSLLACIRAKLPIVAACREAIAFEDSFDAGDGPRRCWVSLLPFSANGTWIDFVYGYVSLEGAGEIAEEAEEAEPEPVEEEMAAAPETDAIAEEAEPEAPDPFAVELKPYDEEPEAAQGAELEAPVPEAEPELADDQESDPDERTSFTAKVMGSLASVGGFYGKVVQSGPDLPPEAFVEESIDAEPLAEIEPVAEIEPAAEIEPGAEIEPAAEPQPVQEPAFAVEGSLQNKLSDVRALAEAAREAQVRSNQALYAGLSAAYDFALDAEEAPEDYLRLVEAQGLKIQLRSPMKPVVRLAFDGQCDEPTIPQLEAVLAWALKQDLPRGSLAERIETEGGIGAILNGKAAA
jgi:hypothetical protein